MSPIHRDRSDRSEGRRRAAFTLLELLVAVTVIALLLALLLPAVQRARLTARRTQCRSHLRQIGMAVLSHEAQYGRFPSNGWGFRWVGDPDRGTDERQPGGWVYNILPFVEENNLRTLGAGLPDAEKQAALAEVMETPVELFSCPSRPITPWHRPHRWQSLEYPAAHLPVLLNIGR